MSHINIWAKIPIMVITLHENTRTIHALIVSSCGSAANLLARCGLSGGL
jgi:hypothetical protein